MTLKATALAHPIQGLIKYHGLRNVERRLPFHDSISVCIEGLETLTTVEFDEDLSDDVVEINKRTASETEKRRVQRVLDSLRAGKGRRVYARVTSTNSLTTGKGLGFSASAFASIGIAASHALNLELDSISLSEAVRLGAGSATRSLAGGFAVWYADKQGRSYAEQIAAPGNLDLEMVIVPVPSLVGTDEAHRDVVTSPLFSARLQYIDSMIAAMREALSRRDVATVCKLAEEDTLNLHAITMTAESRMVLWEPQTLTVLREVLRLREDGIPCWYSMDTGPSVFVNTLGRYADMLERSIKELCVGPVIRSRVGGPPELISRN